MREPAYFRHNWRRRNKVIDSNNGTPVLSSRTRIKPCAARASPSHTRDRRASSCEEHARRERARSEAARAAKLYFFPPTQHPIKHTTRGRVKSRLFVICLSANLRTYCTEGSSGVQPDPAPEHSSSSGRARGLGSSTIRIRYPTYRSFDERRMHAPTIMIGNEPRSLYS